MAATEARRVAIRIAERHELHSALILAVATVLTAWAAFQSAN